VTNADYRSSWINREYTGTASFSVRVGANGRVEACSITGGSAPQELKDATCSLIQRRARFKPATNGNGDDVAGNYSSTVRWEIPE
jgi:protein TonB